MCSGGFLSFCCWENHIWSFDFLLWKCLLILKVITVTLFKDLDAAYRKLPVQKVLIWLLWPSQNIFISWHNPFKGSVTLRNKVFWLFSPTWRRDKRWVKLRYYLQYLKYTVLRKEEEKQGPRFFAVVLHGSLFHVSRQLGQPNCNGDTKGNKH